jgi:hypothetical protein
MVRMKAHSMIVSNGNTRARGANVSARVADSCQANTAPTLAVALMMVSTRIAKPPSDCRWIWVRVLVAIILEGEAEIENNAHPPADEKERHLAQIIVEQGQ